MIDVPVRELREGDLVNVRMYSSSSGVQYSLGTVVMATPTLCFPDDDEDTEKFYLQVFIDSSIVMSWTQASNTMMQKVDVRTLIHEIEELMECE